VLEDYVRMLHVMLQERYCADKVAKRPVGLVVVDDSMLPISHSGGHSRRTTPIIVRYC
jgi:hypothetical protein